MRRTGHILGAAKDDGSPATETGCFFAGTPLRGEFLCCFLSSLKESRLKNNFPRNHALAKGGQTLPTELALPRQQILFAQRQINRLPVIVVKFYANLLSQKQILQARLGEVEK